jgi:hypothetical protein
MSVENNIMIVDWEIFESNYSEFSNSEFLIELMDELDTGEDIIKNEWFEYFDLEFEAQSASLIGNMYEEVDEVINQLQEIHASLLTEVMGILNVDLTDQVTDIKLHEEEFWLYSTYNPTSVKNMLDKISKLLPMIETFDIEEELKDSFSSFVKMLKEIFNKASNSNRGLLIAIG